MLGMLYFHQRDLYYGDMKAPNLLVFRTQEVKIGDLGTTIKLDKEGNDEEMKYRV